MAEQIKISKKDYFEKVLSVFQCGDKIVWDEETNIITFGTDAYKLSEYDVDNEVETIF